MSTNFAETIESTMRDKPFSAEFEKIKLTYPCKSSMFNPCIYKQKKFVCFYESLLMVLAL